MKKAGDLLSAILDEKTLGKVKEYSRIFSAWEQLNTKYGIAAAANHSHVKDIQHGVLIVEADHPGWIQILQTKEHLLLADLQRFFPDLGINGLAFKLENPSLPPADLKPASNPPDEPPAADNRSAPVDETAGSGYEKIKNKELAEMLKNLAESISRKGETPY